MSEEQHDAAPHPGGMFGVTGSGDTSGYGGLVLRHGALPSSPRPYGGYLDEVADSLEQAYPGFNDKVLRAVVEHGELTLVIRPDAFAEVAQVLRDEPSLRFELLSNLSGVDYLIHRTFPDEDRRLHVVADLMSMTYARRIRIETAVSEADPHVPSLTAVYPGADWQEREAYDFFGVVFDGHPALTRIEMPDDWDGHPQRKDYPLGGVEVQYKGATVPPPDTRRSYA